MKQVIFFILLFIGFLSPAANAQNVGEIVNSKLLTARGYLSGGYSNISSDNQALKNLNPNIFNLSAGLNLSIKGLQIPFNFLYSSDQGSSFSTREVTRLGISPYYKWARVFIGQNAMNFSPYIYAGTSFNGVGVELKPGKFRFAAFRGKLDQSFFAPTTQGIIIRDDQNVYDRNALGIKLGFGSAKTFIDLYAFKAKDDANNILSDSLRTLGVLPGDNVAVGLRTKFTIKKALSLEINGAGSAVTSDQQAIPVTFAEEDMDLINRVENFIVVNSSSRYAFAYDARLGLDFKYFGIGFKYQHIDPFYNTYGINFINDDLDNYFFDLRLNLAKSTFNLFASFGLENNNTKEYLSLSESRKIGSLNLDWRPNDRLSLGANFNNFGFNNQASLVEISDTIALASVSNSLGFNTSYRIGDKKNPKTINLSYNSNTYEIREREELTNSSDMNSYNLNWRQNFKKKKFNYGIGLNVSDFTTSDTTQVGRRGINLRLGTTAFKILRLGVRAQILQNITDGTRDGTVFNMGFSASSSFKKGYSFSLFSRFVKRQTVILDPINTLNSRVQLKKTF